MGKKEFRILTRYGAKTLDRRRGACAVAGLLVAITRCRFGYGSMCACSCVCNCVRDMESNLLN